ASRGIAAVPTESPSARTIAIPRLRRFAPSLGMTVGAREKCHSAVAKLYATEYFDIATSPPRLSPPHAPDDSQPLEDLLQRHQGPQRRLARHPAGNVRTPRTKRRWQ